MEAYSEMHDQSEDKFPVIMNVKSFQDATNPVFSSRNSIKPVQQNQNIVRNKSNSNLQPLAHTNKNGRRSTSRMSVIPEKNIDVQAFRSQNPSYSVLGKQVPKPS